MLSILVVCLMIKILSILGTRPEAIKMAPVLNALHKTPWATPTVCITAQHREMLDGVLEFFSITPDFDLNLMAQGQSLNGLLAKIFNGLQGVFEKTSPDVVLVQGDTATCLAGALAAFNLRIPVGHIEAGLRTGDLQKPYPEEGNRQMVSRIARFHFAPTETAAQNLRQENLPSQDIIVTGNTVIDALMLAGNILEECPQKGRCHALPEAIYNGTMPFILVTGHRRESFGSSFEHICLALKTLADNHPELGIVYPAHLNPNVQTPVLSILNDKPNVYILPPQPYPVFIDLMRQCRFILTDSGGIQEEAPALHKPLLVMRDRTERPEAVDTGAALLVGTDTGHIVQAAEKLLTDMNLYSSMAIAENPFGDGYATQRIIRHLYSNFAGDRT